MCVVMYSGDVTSKQDRTTCPGQSQRGCTTALHERFIRSLHFETVNTFKTEFLTAIWCQIYTYPVRKWLHEDCTDTKRPAMSQVLILDATGTSCFQNHTKYKFHDRCSVYSLCSDYVVGGIWFHGRSTCYIEAYILKRC